MKWFNVVSASVLSSLLFTLASGSAQAQFNSANKKQIAEERCTIVMRKVAIERGVNFGRSPCANNVYSVELWQCVDEKITAGGEFNIAVRRCERKIGLR